MYKRKATNAHTWKNCWSVRKRPSERSKITQTLSWNLGRDRISCEQITSGQTRHLERKYGGQLIRIAATIYEPADSADLRERKVRRNWNARRESRSKRNVGADAFHEALSSAAWSQWNRQWRMTSLPGAGRGGGRRETLGQARSKNEKHATRYPKACFVCAGE